MPDQQRIETRRRNRGHTEEDQHTGQERPEFVLQARMLVAEQQEHDEYQRQADSDGRAGPEQNAGNHGQRAHTGVSGAD